MTYDHSKDVPAHTHGGTDAPDCTTCGPVKRDSLLLLAETWESMASRPNGIYEQCARDLRQQLKAQQPKWDLAESLLALADAWDRRLWLEHGLVGEPELQRKFTDWHSRQARELVRRYREDKMV